LTTIQPLEINIRRAENRGVTNAGWLHSRHAFSFGQYQDPDNTHYRVMRVLNDDIVAPGGGFPEHRHDNMEILTWVLDGALKHGDSLGHMQELHHGELQVMSAGHGITHSELNASDVKPVHFLQIWLFPTSHDIEPRYLQNAFNAQDRQNQWDTVASGGHHATALPIHQDAQLRIADLDAGSSLKADIAHGRYAYMHIAYGEIEVGGIKLGRGDALTCTGATNLNILATKRSEVLWLDLS